MRWNSTPIPFEFASYQFRDLVKMKDGDVCKTIDLKVFDNYLVFDE